MLLGILGWVSASIVRSIREMRYHRSSSGQARASVFHLAAISSSKTLLCQSGLSVRRSMTSIMATSRTSSMTESAVSGPKQSKWMLSG